MADSVSVWISPEGEVHVYSPMGLGPGRTVPFAASPPHTLRERMVACLDRGENVHGDLFEEFYVLTDDGYEPARYVLWSGASGSQCDDNRARLEPVAYLEIGELPEFVEREDQEYTASLVLLCARIRIVSEAEWGDYEVDTSSDEGTLPEEVIKKLLEIGNSSDRLDLHDLLLVEAADEAEHRC